ncbi:YkvA family protein [Rubeoparvulum massiliense]|uniref:YkvA family protein n=1 Tax=Rubeoparvulum massiliense TaxID=1631346 RepID=UPI00065DBE2E|nr:YkvA family protein [Rubeoparvulum massiliense]
MKLSKMPSRSKIIGHFRQGKWLGRAKEVVANPKELSSLLHQVEAKSDGGGRWQELKEQIHLLTQLVRDWYQGIYSQVDKRSLIFIVGGLLYFVVPFDLVPDWIIALGFFDDAAVIAFIIQQVQGEIDRYKEWKEEQDQIIPLLEEEGK